MFFPFNFHTEPPKGKAAQFVVLRLKYFHLYLQTTAAATAAARIDTAAAVLLLLLLTLLLMLLLLMVLLVFIVRLYLFPVQVYLAKTPPETCKTARHLSLRAKHTHTCPRARLRTYLTFALRFRLVHL